MEIELDNKYTCEVCEVEFEVTTEDEDVEIGYCPMCGSLLFEEDEIQELETDEENDGW